MKPNSPLPAESSIHFLPSGGWALGIPVSKSGKSKLTKIIGVPRRSIPTAQHSYSVPYLSLVTGTSGCHLHTQAGLLSSPSPPQQSKHNCSMWKMIQALIQRNPKEGGDEDETNPAVRSSFLKPNDGSTRFVTFLYFLHLKKKTRTPCGLSMLFSTFSETS